MPKVLLLCHKPKDAFYIPDGSHCESAGIPLSLSVLHHVQTLDIGRVPETATHHRQDLRKPLSASKARQLGSSFDLVTTVCCSYTAFVKPLGQGIEASAWKNVAHMLRPGGFFVFTTAGSGMESLAQFLSLKVKNPQKIRREVMKAFCRYVDKQSSDLRFKSIPMTSQSAFGRWYSAFESKYAAYGDGFMDGSLRESRNNGIVVFQRT